MLNDTEKRQEVLDHLKELQIDFQIHEHPPLPTIEIAREYWKDIPGVTHCKNLFFRNHKGNRHYLVVLHCDQLMDIHQMEKVLRQGKISFASPERMEKYLGLSPGSVSPFGLIHDKERQVKLFIDKNLQNTEYVSFHPNENTASLVLKTRDLIRFLDHWGGEYEFIELY